EGLGALARGVRKLPGWRPQGVPAEARPPPLDAGQAERARALYEGPGAAPPHRHRGLPGFSRLPGCRTPGPVRARAPGRYGPGARPVRWAGRPRATAPALRAPAAVPPPTPPPRHRRGCARGRAGPGTAPGHGWRRGTPRPAPVRRRGTGPRASRAPGARG